MIVWRVEKGETGPYQGGVARMIVNACAGDPYNKPPPCNDYQISDWWEKLRDRRHWRFGFISLRQFRAWFDTDEGRDMLHDEGYKLAAYRVRDVNASNHQAVFLLQGAEKLGERSCNNWD